MNAELLAGLKRAIAALNLKPNFPVHGGIWSYELLAELDELVRKAEEETVEDTT